MQKKIISFVLIAVLLAMPTLIMAQPADLCPNPADPDCPIDSGTILLVAAVIGIAAIKSFRYSNISKKVIV